MTSSKSKSLKAIQRKEREARILEEAYHLLLEKGYYEASMDEIAARVGISKGTLYLHFKSKEDLIFVLMEGGLSKFISLVDQIILEERSVQERIRRILLETYRSIQDGRHYLVALRAIGLNKGLIRDRLEEQVSQAGLMERLSRLFEEGKQSGEFDVAIPTALLVSVFLGLMEIYSSEQAEISHLPPETLFEAVNQLFLHGALARP